MNHNSTDIESRRRDSVVSKLDMTSTAEAVKYEN
jgi:hypothetical protein